MFWNIVASLSSFAQPMRHKAFSFVITLYKYNIFSIYWIFFIFSLIRLNTGLCSAPRYNLVNFWSLNFVLHPFETMLSVGGTKTLKSFFSLLFRKSIGRKFVKTQLGARRQHQHRSIILDFRWRALCVISKHCSTVQWKICIFSCRTFEGLACAYLLYEVVLRLTTGLHQNVTTLLKLFDSINELKIWTIWLYYTLLIFISFFRWFDLTISGVFFKDVKVTG